MNRFKMRVGGNLMADITAGIWSEKTKVRFGGVDRSDRLTLWSVFNSFQEAAIYHATELGVGRNAMAAAGQAWILSRLSLFIERRPVYGEEIEICTWPRRWEKLFALRDYAIRDAEGAMVIRGRGAWLVLDVEKRRPLRPQSMMETLPLYDKQDAFSSVPAGLTPRENSSKAGERVAVYSDIDCYGHVNSARYIQWIQDLIDVDILTNANQARLDINYLSEVLPGDTVELWKAPFDNAPGENETEYPRKPSVAFAFEGRRPDSGQPVFRAELCVGD